MVDVADPDALGPDGLALALGPAPGPADADTDADTEPADADTEPADAGPEPADAGPELPAVTDGATGVAADELLVAPAAGVAGALPPPPAEARAVSARRPARPPGLRIVISATTLTTSSTGSAYARHPYRRTNRRSESARVG